ncbi:Asp-tRNA(Asn)/Glu-tRNA(Gln) amidotransferase subunit GatC [Patescibacteria group bacterium]|nr:Asp-tRNA(Asn)/Glu-tRNA(Gln) amidotransferase subunit GatC [Patescibacteria group bacterium]
MKITKDTVEHIADLARLKLSAKEIENYQEDLSAIVSYVDKLKKADLHNYLATEQISGLHNVYREDEVIDTSKEESLELLKASAHYSEKDKQIKVKRILK